MECKGQDDVVGCAYSNHRAGRAGGDAAAYTPALSRSSQHASHQQSDPFAPDRASNLQVSEDDLACLCINLLSQVRKKFFAGHHLETDGAGVLIWLLVSMVVYLACLGITRVLAQDRRLGWLVGVGRD